ncbi:MAG: hypothetical protein KGL12_15195 [Rhodospirillales bacterium]|nr:hypothetical protein [Rhodospirillales bacterium]
MSGSPLLEAKDHAAASVFHPENLLREARRQRGLPDVAVPALCVLDPDGDVVRALETSGRGIRHPGWACYHTRMLTFRLGGRDIGIVGCAVGAPFAVLVAEQMFASGCALLISLTSAGRIAADLPEEAFFLLIDKALRDEGTSHHYLPAGPRFAAGDRALIDAAAAALANAALPVLRGATWTTDAPFRETERAIAGAAAAGVQAVEMEAAALYAFATARRRAVLCIAHVTNQMARIEGDFEKGEADGAHDALAVLGELAAALPMPPA